MSATPEATLASAVDGDLTALTELARMDKTTLTDLAEARPVLHAETVAKVLAAHLAGQLPAPKTQAWAAFVRSGVVGDSSTNIYVEYEAASEDSIVEAIAPMYELGGPIDGVISREPGSALIADLTSRLDYSPTEESSVISLNGEPTTPLADNPTL